MYSRSALTGPSPVSEKKNKFNPHMCANHSLFDQNRNITEQVYSQTCIYFYCVNNKHEAELNLTRLPASLCQEVNRRAADNMKGQKISFKCNGGASNEFYIKTTDNKAYGSYLSTPLVMQVYPKSMCPNREDHLVKIYLQKLDLPLACPTCWSLQRNA